MAFKRTQSRPVLLGLEGSSGALARAEKLRCSGIEMP